MTCHYRDRDLAPCPAVATTTVVFTLDDGETVGPCYYCPDHAPTDTEVTAPGVGRAKPRRVSISASPVRTPAAGR